MYANRNNYNHKMPRTNEINKQIKDERKQSILFAALPLFALYGDKVSVDMICEKAKCSHGLLYHYFRDANNVLFNIKKMDSYITLKNKILSFQNNDFPLDSIYQIINSVNSVLSKPKQDELSMLVLIMGEEEKDGLKNKLNLLIKQGQKNGQITAGKAEDICSIYINQNIGVLLKKLLQKSYKIEIVPADNQLQIFNKKTAH